METAISTPEFGHALIFLALPIIWSISAIFFALLFKKVDNDFFGNFVLGLIYSPLVWLLLLWWWLTDNEI